MSIPLRLGPTGRPAGRGAHLRLVWEMACLGLALTPCPGCGRDCPPATVEGTLTLDGKPLDNCLITFSPEPGQGPNSPHSTGLTDRHGSYRLRCAHRQEGAATGWHRVTIQDLSVSTGVRRLDHGTVDVEMEETAPPPPVRRSRVAGRYMSLRNTALRKEVKPGHQVIDLNLK